MSVPGSQTYLAVGSWEKLDCTISFICIVLAVYHCTCIHLEGYPKVSYSGPRGEDGGKSLRRDKQGHP